MVNCEEKQVMSSVGSEADLVGEDSARGQLEEKEVTVCLLWEGRGWAGPLLPAPCFLLLREASQGKTCLPPSRVWCLSVGPSWVRT